MSRSMSCYIEGSGKVRMKGAECLHRTGGINESEM